MLPYTSIQLAINAASANDVIVVTPGVHDEGAQIEINKNITLRSTTGVSTDVVLSGGGNHRVINITDNAAVTINYLTIRNGYTVDYGGGIRVYVGCILYMQYCIFYHNLFPIFTSNSVA